MSTPLERYRELEEELRKLRIEHDVGSDAEDPVIEEMTDVWWRLTKAEQAWIDAEGPTCWPRRRTCDCGTETTQAPREVVSYSIPNCHAKSTLWYFDPHNAPCGQPCLMGINGNWPLGAGVDDVHGAITKRGRDCPRGCYDNAAWRSE